MKYGLRMAHNTSHRDGITNVTQLKFHQAAIRIGQPFQFLSEPGLERSSNSSTRRPSERNRFARFVPINPAPPVIKTGPSGEGEL